MNPTALTEHVGRVFGERYRAEELIGVGAVSAVFVADDLETGSRVALKVFDERLASDQRFVERLLHAAQNAAALDHPNVARIEDWGDTPEPFIVSELCEGGSLRAVLDAEDRLTPSQALVMALECARALHYGHEVDVVHRNLKPQNILFSSDQRVRITDYGLGKVMADAPLTQTDRVLENVRYSSPEQARGRPVTDRSDMYSLALIVNEAVSGEAPAVAETVVGTLMARAESPAELSDKLKGLLPAIERCGRIEPEQRPEAEELTIALLAAAETMARPAAFPLVGIGSASAETAVDSQDVSSHVDAEVEDPRDRSDEVEDATPSTSQGGPEVEYPDVDDSKVLELDDAPPSAESEPELTVVAEPAGGLENLAEADPVFAQMDESDQTLDIPRTSAPTASGRVAYESAEEDDADERLPWWPLLALMMVVAGALVGGFFLYQGVTNSGSSTVPNLVGSSYEQLDDVVGDDGWQIETLELRVAGSGVGSILAQNPAPGTRLDRGETLSVTVSLGDPMVEIPSDIVGLTLDQAASRLGSVGLTLGPVTEAHSEALASGLVVGLNEPTTQKPEGEGVAVLVSLGPEERVVPDSVIGMNVAEATSLLAALRLQAVAEPVFDPLAAEGTVLGTMPEPGETVAADSQIIVLVSAGPEPVEIPDIAGLPLGEAVDALEELGLIFIDSEGTIGEDAIGTDPPIGATVDVGTEVIVILDDPSEDEEGTDDG